jgi:dihydrofolate reductase
MTQVTCDIGVSVDGFAAGPDQTRTEPLGKGAERLHRWMFEEPEAHQTWIDAITDAGAFVMGRNMYAGPGDWDEGWKGWWGDDPPYHAPVFVLTHQAREPVPMEGGTTFHFVTEGIDAALARAREAAGDRDVAIAGGASTINQYLAAGHIDELRVHVAPVVLGAGERLFEGVGDIGLEAVETEGTGLVTHVRYRVVR